MERNLRPDRADGGFLRARLTRRYDSDANETPGPSPSTVWTDEKHHMYIHSMEASFVQQLHQSISLRGGLRGDCNSSQQLGFQSRHRNEELLESTSDSCYLEGSSQDAKHVASNYKLYAARCKDGKRVRNELPVSTESSNESECCLSRQDSVHSVLEVSDQNFVDGEAEENSCYASTLKRWKTDANEYQY
ncbi:hypothetical protein LINPERPRIM_LOCUS16671 [Linum perenne]